MPQPSEFPSDCTVTGNLFLKEPLTGRCTSTREYSAAGTSRPNMARDLEPMQQEQEKQVPSAEVAVGPEGGDNDGANDARQLTSEFGVGVRLNARGCRWPDNTSASEMRAWSARLWVSLAMVVGASSVDRTPGRRRPPSFCVCFTPVLVVAIVLLIASWFCTMHVFDAFLLFFRLRNGLNFYRVQSAQSMLSSHEHSREQTSELTSVVHQRRNCTCVCVQGKVLRSAHIFSYHLAQTGWHAVHPVCFHEVLSPQRSSVGLSHLGPCSHLLRTTAVNRNTAVLLQLAI